MLDFLILGSVWSAIKFDIVSALYSVVAYVYDIMIELVESGHGSLANYTFQDISTVIYTIAGVFMLFRITISMLQMLANPDLVNDSNAGAGKILIRVVLVIVLLLLFIPDGLVFNKKDGLAVEIEEALLADDGLINNLVKISDNGSKKKTEAAVDPISSKELVSVGGTALSEYKKNNSFIETAYAAEPTLKCYYAFVKSHAISGESRNIRHTYNISSVYKIGFFEGKGGERKVAGTNYTYTSYTYHVGGNEAYGSYSKLDKQISGGDFFKNSFPTSCPKSFKANGGKWEAVKSYPNNASSIKKCTPTLVDSTIDADCKETGFFGYNTYSEFLRVAKDLRADPTGNTGSYTVDDDSQKFFTENSSVDATTKDTNVELLKGVRKKSREFATNAMSSFQECTAETADGKEACEAVQADMLSTIEGKAAMSKAIEDEQIIQEFMMSVILGLGLIIYLAFLCVDVVVRKFKLMLLEVLAPIPIICYVDPKDKIFTQWIKTYLTVYVDLFIKLLAIRIGIDILDQVWKGFGINYDHALAKLFYIIGVLVFIKVIPDLISNIFGFKMNGSFKEIGGMFKKAAGLGAMAGGAAVGMGLGAAAGAVTAGGGIGNRLLSGIQGGLRGAGSGSKKDIYGGAQSIARTNQYKKELPEGTSTFGRMFGEMKENMGIGEYQKQKNQIEADHDAIAAQKASLFADKQKQARQEGAKAEIKKFEDKVESNVLNKNVYDGKVAEVDSFRLAQANVETAKSAAAALIRNAQTATYANDQERTTAIANARAEGARLISESQSELRSAQKKAFDAAKEYEVSLYNDPDKIEKMDKNARVALDSIRSYNYDLPHSMLKMLLPAKKIQTLCLR